jgi:hypothetical protein
VGASVLFWSAIVRQSHFTAAYRKLCDSWRCIIRMTASGALASLGRLTEENRGFMSNLVPFFREYQLKAHDRTGIAQTRREG